MVGRKHEATTTTVFTCRLGATPFFGWDERNKILVGISQRSELS